MALKLYYSAIFVFFLGNIGRSYEYGLPKGPPMLALGLGAGFISEAPVIHYAHITM
jgi:hypothetical protein